MSALPQHDERVTCLSCRFSYPGVRGFCPMCGTPAPAPEEVAGGSRRIGPKAVSNASPGSNVRTSVKKMARRPLVIAVGFLLVASTLFFLRAHSAAPDIISPAPASAAAPPEVAPSLPPAPETVAVQPESPSQEPRVAVARPATVAPATTDDPTELWKRVRNGNTDAEVTLARFYLDGKGVTQNCEQAHLLLLAAAKKQSRTAGLLLSGVYPLRCP